MLGETWVQLVMITSPWCLQRSLLCLIRSTQHRGASLSLLRSTELTLTTVRQDEDYCMSTVLFFWSRSWASLESVLTLTWPPFGLDFSVSKLFGLRLPRTWLLCYKRNNTHAHSLTCRLEKHVRCSDDGNVNVNILVEKVNKYGNMKISTFGWDFIFTVVSFLCFHLFFFYYSFVSIPSFPHDSSPACFPHPLCLSLFTTQSLLDRGHF